MARKTVSENEKKGDPADGGRIAIQTGNIGFLTVKLLSDINDNIKKLISVLEEMNNG